jgi:pyruvate dehydrogenase E2 component (dihydrolipoamide acetyltransferase)
MFGIDSFTSIINPPQVCILAVGQVEKIFLPDQDNNPKLCQQMKVTLSSDHRVVDGAIGAKWLARLQYYLENPYELLL